MKKGSTDPLTASRILVYTLAKALAISPLDIYNLPMDLALDMLTIHTEVEKLKAEEMEKEMKKNR